MADPFASGFLVADGDDITAEQHNDAWANLEDYLNARIGNLTDAQILIANASGQVVGKSVSGDATLSRLGVLTIANNAINNAKMADNSVGAAEIASLPSAALSKSGNQSIPDDTLTALTWDTEGHDSAALHDNVTNPSRLTAPIAGVYSVTGTICFDANSTGRRAGAIRSNGAVFEATEQSLTPLSGIEAFINVAALVKLAAAEYVELVAYHTKGSALSVIGDPALVAAIEATKCRFAMHWLGDG